MTDTLFDPLSPEQRKLLERYRFDLDTLSRLQRELSQGAFEGERNRLTDTVEPPPDDAVLPWPTGANAERLAAVGQAAIDAGEVASLILNGGMATRFGGVVKGVVEVLPNQSFIGLKLGHIQRTAPKTAVFLMNSFATDADTRRHLEALSLPGLEVHHVTQGISVRMTPNGELFRTRDGEPSFYAPGHGDVFSSLAASDAFRAFAANGGKTVMVSNVDNLAATLDPIVIGTHLEHRAPITTEVAPKNPGDKGGAPALVQGRVQVVEGFRFPADFDQDSIRVFNTNTLTFDVSVFEQEPPLNWFRADKTVEDQPVVQFERLMGEATAFLDSCYLEVPREGRHNRFMPVKTPADLVELRETIASRLAV